MIKNELYLEKIRKKINKCEKDIKNDVNVEIREKQLASKVGMLLTIKHITNIVEDWEKKNNKWFGGSVNDVMSYQDLVEHCNESIYGEKPIDLIVNGTYIPINGSVTKTWDLRHYFFLPSLLIEENREVTVVTYRDLLNPHMLNEEKVGFFGDSEFTDKDGKLKLGYWSFLTLFDAWFRNVEYPTLDDEADIDVILKGDGYVELFNDNGNLCGVEFYYGGC